MEDLNRWCNLQCNRKWMWYSRLQSHHVFHPYRGWRPHVDYPAWDGCPGKRPQGGCNGNPWGSALNWSLFPVLRYPTWKASCFMPWGLGKSVIFRGRVLICLNQDHELMLNGPGQTGERRGISHSPGKMIFPWLKFCYNSNFSLIIFTNCFNLYW